MNLFEVSMSIAGVIIFIIGVVTENTNSMLIGIGIMIMMTHVTHFKT